MSIATVIGKACFERRTLHEASRSTRNEPAWRRCSVQPPHQRQTDCFGSDTIRQMRPYHFARTDGRSALSPYLSPEGWLVTNETPFVNIPNYPEEDKVMAEINKLPHKILLNVDKVAKEVGSARVANIVLLGATIPFLGIDYEKVQDSIREIFLRKGEAIVEMNLKALAAGKEIAEKLMQ